MTNQEKLEEFRLEVENSIDLIDAEMKHGIEPDAAEIDRIKKLYDEISRLEDLCNEQN
jgi:hypothetical protein